MHPKAQLPVPRSLLRRSVARLEPEVAPDIGGQNQEAIVRRQSRVTIVFVVRNGFAVCAELFDRERLQVRISAQNRLRLFERRRRNRRTSDEGRIRLSLLGRQIS